MVRPKRHQNHQNRPKGQKHQNGQTTPKCLSRAHQNDQKIIKNTHQNLRKTQKNVKFCSRGQKHQKWSKIALIPPWIFSHTPKMVKKPKTPKPNLPILPLYYIVHVPECDTYQKSEKPICY